MARNRLQLRARRTEHYGSRNQCRPRNGRCLRFVSSGDSSLAHCAQLSRVRSAGLADVEASPGDEAVDTPAPRAGINGAFVFFRALPSADVGSSFKAMCLVSTGPITRVHVGSVPSTLHVERRSRIRGRDAPQAPRAGEAPGFTPDPSSSPALRLAFEDSQQFEIFFASRLLGLSAPQGAQQALRWGEARSRRRLAVAAMLWRTNALLHSSRHRVGELQVAHWRRLARCVASALCWFPVPSGSLLVPASPGTGSLVPPLKGDLGTA
jgi:hypothetical protein